MNHNPILFPITYKCNLSCEFCKAKDSSREEPDIKKSLELIKNSDEEWIFITGGEPLMVDNIEDICNEIKSYGKKVGLTTNGTINNSRLHLFTDRVGVSIDGNKKYHNEYRNNSFDNAVNFLKSLIGKVETVLMFTKFEENKNQEDYIIQLAEDIGVDHLQITKGIV